jgi:hypothetical protein
MDGSLWAEGFALGSFDRGGRCLGGDSAKMNGGRTRRRRRRRRRNV